MGSLPLREAAQVGLKVMQAYSTADFLEGIRPEAVALREAARPPAESKIEKPAAEAGGGPQPQKAISGRARKKFIHSSLNFRNSSQHVHI